MHNIVINWKLTTRSFFLCFSRINWIFFLISFDGFALIWWKRDMLWKKLAANSQKCFFLSQFANKVCSVVVLQFNNPNNKILHCEKVVLLGSSGFFGNDEWSLRISANLVWRLFGSNSAFCLFNFIFVHLNDWSQLRWKMWLRY